MTNQIKILALASFVLILSNSIFAGECEALFPFTNSKAKMGYIDCNGNVIVNPIFWDASEFSDGVGRIRVDDEQTQTGIVDLDGKIKMFTQFKLVSDFHEGLGLAVDKNKNACFIDKNGVVKITLPQNTMFFEDDPTLPVVSVFRDGIANVNLTDGTLLFIGKDGNKLFSFGSNMYKASNFSGGLSHVSVTDEKRRMNDTSYEGEAGVIDKTGRFVIEPKERKTQDRIITYDPVDGLVRLREGKTKYIFYNKLGEIVLECSFDFVGDFINGLALVEIDKKYGFINKQGKICIPIIYEYADDFSENLAEIATNDKFGFIDTTGKVAIPATFDSIIQPFRFGLAYVTKGKFEGYINKKGKWVWKKSIE